MIRNVACKRVQVDEIWSFVYVKHGHLASAKRAPIDAGDVWTWTALCADTNLIVSFMVGDRTSHSAVTFLDDVKDRLAGRVQLSSDALLGYAGAVNYIFSDEIDYAQLDKIYSNEPEGEKRYNPPKCIGIKRKIVSGNPDPRHISRSYAKRQNLTMRMHMRRFTRLTNCFSKKIENHACAVALHTMFYNFVRVHQTLKRTPAMAASITDRRWEMTDLVALVEAWEARAVVSHRREQIALSHSN